MSHPPCIESSTRSGSLWRLSLGFLLLCGLIGWTSATPPAASQLAVPLYIDQVEQPALAGSTENPRARPTLRKDGTAAESKDGGGGYDDSLHGPTIVTLLPEGLSVRSVAYIFSSPHLPASARYALPAPREPPNA